MSFVTDSNGKDENYQERVHDVVYTPEKVAQKILASLPIKDNDTLYDPFAGKNMVFYNNFPKENIKHWSEIELGRDFFDFKEHIDWIISNPPYSKFTELMTHSYELADNIVYLIPLNKVVSSWGRIQELHKYGGIYKLFIMPASKCGFPFGFPACACWFKKDYHGDISYELWDLEKYHQLDIFDFL